MPLINHSSILVTDEYGRGVALAADDCSVCLLKMQHAGSQDPSLAYMPDVLQFQSADVEDVINDMCFVGELPAHYHHISGYACQNAYLLKSLLLFHTRQCPEPCHAAL